MSKMYFLPSGDMTTRPPSPLFIARGRQRPIQRSLVMKAWSWPSPLARTCREPSGSSRMGFRLEATWLLIWQPRLLSAWFR
ncbi:hypothetical protein D3C72_1992290 [compost metagenome]